MKKKIGLYLGSGSAIGGTFQYSIAMLTAVRSLPRDRYDVLCGYAEDQWHSYLLELDLPVTFIRRDAWSRFLSRIARQGRYPMAWWRQIFPWLNPAARVILRQKCDLWIFPAGDEWSYEIPTQALVTIHDLMHRYERRFAEVSAHGVYEAREKQNSRICQWARGVLVHAETGKHQVVESYHINPELVHVLPMVPPAYIFQPEKVEGFEERYSLPRKFIFYPANFFEHKNHAGLIRAAALLQSKLPDFSLVFAGSPYPPEGYAALQKMIRDYNLTDRVHFLGYIPDKDMVEMYRRARAMVMPSFFGPCNIPPLEAIALGCPAAVADVYGAREQLEQAVLYFNPAIDQEIANTLEILWENDDLCQELSRQGLIQASLWNQTHFNAALGNIIDAILY
jgi:glycosyltransferase involved in cell wall biosynthesis